MGKKLRSSEICMNFFGVGNNTFEGHKNISETLRSMNCHKSFTFEFDLYYVF